MLIAEIKKDLPVWFTDQTGVRLPLVVKDPAPTGVVGLVKVSGLAGTYFAHPVELTPREVVSE